MTRRRLVWGAFGVFAAGAAALSLLWNAAPDPVESGLTDTMGSWVAALDDWGRAYHDGEATDASQAALAKARAALMNPALVDALQGAGGEPLVSAFSATLDAVRAQVRGGAEEGLQARAGATYAALNALNDALAAAELPWFLDVDWSVRSRRPGHAQTALLSFHVDARQRWAVLSWGDDPAMSITVVYVRRADSLNWSRGLLGYTRETLNVAVVSTDKLEAQLVTYVGPALANNTAMPIFGRQSRDASSPWQQAVRNEAGRVARRAFEGALPDDITTFRDFGAALADRKRWVVTWRHKLGQHGYRLTTPDSLQIDPAMMTSLRELLPDFRVTELEDIQRRVTSDRFAATFERMMQRHARSVATHEVRHRQDFSLGDDFIAPATLLRQMGHDPALPPTKATRRAALELSAYLAEIAADADWAPMNLTLLAAHVFGDGWGSAEWHAAVAILDGLAAELGITARTRRGSRVRQRLAADVYLSLVRAEPVSLADAAKALWERWFQRPLVWGVIATERDL